MKQIITELKSVKEKLGEVDDVLYNNNEMYDEGEKIREAYLQIDELIDALE